jgi:hypothetical protein
MGDIKDIFYVVGPWDKKLATLQIAIIIFIKLIIHDFHGNQYLIFVYPHDINLIFLHHWCSVFFW